jgi:serine/threonine protein kinase
MPESQSENLKDLFRVAAGLPAAERGRYLEQACAGNSSLREKLESLLHSHDETTSLLHQPAYESARPIQDDQLKPNQIVAHYRICSLLGKGGMGSVYLAEDTKLKRNVALKVLPSSNATDESARKRLLREAQAAAALDHPNICAIHEVGEANGTSYIAMQFIEGESLAEILQRRQLTHVEVLTIASHVAEGLAEAHRHNIVQRYQAPEHNADDSWHSKDS